MLDWILDRVFRVLESVEVVVGFVCVLESVEVADRFIGVGREYWSVDGSFGSHCPEIDSSAADDWSLGWLVVSLIIVTPVFSSVSESTGHPEAELISGPWVSVS